MGRCRVVFVVVVLFASVSVPRVAVAQSSAQTPTLLAAALATPLAEMPGQGAVVFVGLMAPAVPLPLMVSLSSALLAQGDAPPLYWYPGPARHQRPSWLMTSLYGLTVATHALDAHSTFRALDAGAFETNPIIEPFARHRVGFVAFKISAAAATLYATHRGSRKLKTAAVALLIGLNVANGALAIHNYRVATPSRR